MICVHIHPPWQPNLQEVYANALNWIENNKEYIETDIRRFSCINEMFYPDVKLDFKFHDEEYFLVFKVMFPELCLTHI